MPACLICGAPMEPFLSFGNMPIANGFLRPEDFPGEFFFELQVGHCPHCQMVQLTELVNPSRLFHENYAYFSSTSAYMTRHFKEFADFIKAGRLPGNHPLIVEIGSNDGILLQNFKQPGLRHLGVEPSANVAQAAREKGLETVTRFFNAQTGAELRQEYGPADVIVGANVICHLPDIHSVLRGVKALLQEKGLFIFEEPYLGDIVQKTSYDQIYDEHVYYFCLHSLGHLFAEHDLEIIEVQPQKVHGGSMRYLVARRGAWPVQPVVAEHLAREKQLGLTDPETYANLREAVYRSRDRLVGLLRDLKGQGRRLVGYGATSKSTTVTNFCGLGPELIEFISDTTPGKQGKFSPGAHIPVLPYQRFQENYPAYALLFAWNHAEEIMAKEGAFRASGGKWVLYVPEVMVLG